MRRSAIKCSAADVNSILAESQRRASRLNYLAARLGEKQRGPGGQRGRGRGRRAKCCMPQVLDGRQEATRETTGANKVTARRIRRMRGTSSRGPRDLPRKKPNPREANKCYYACMGGVLLCNINGHVAVRLSIFRVQLRGPARRGRGLHNTSSATPPVLILVVLQTDRGMMPCAKRTTSK